MLCFYQSVRKVSVSVSQYQSSLVISLEYLEYYLESFHQMATCYDLFELYRQIFSIVGSLNKCVKHTG